MHEIYAIEAFTYDDVHADNKLYLIGERVFYVYDITTPTYIYIPEKPERMQVFCNAANSTRCIYRIGNEFYLFDRVHPRKIDIEDRLVQGIDSDLYDTNENENCVFSSLCAEEKDAT